MPAYAIGNEVEVLVGLTPAGQARIMHYYRQQGLSLLFVKNQGCWRLPFWLVQDLFEQPSTSPLFAGHTLQVAPTAEADTPGPTFWIYHCSSCSQLTIEPTGQLKFHIFVDLDASSDSDVVLVKRYFLGCSNPRCRTTINYLDLEVQPLPSKPVRSSPRPRHSRPVDRTGAPKAGRKSRRSRSKAEPT